MTLETGPNEPLHDSTPLFSGQEHVKALDGIRGLAILWVMLFHMGMVPAVGHVAQAWYTFTSVGGLGVDVFFALSGFLISGILLRSKGFPYYFRNFYARRVLRIFPLYYAVVFFSLILFPHLTHARDVKFAIAERDAIWYWLHLSNFAIARRGAFVHGILDVSWSLSIEEQFYLVWPLLVWLMRERWLTAICLALIGISWGSRIILDRHGASPIAIYTLTYCRLDSLAIGALACLFVRRNSAAEMRSWVGPLLIGAGAASAFIVTISELSWFRSLTLIATSSTVALATAAAIIASLTSRLGPVARALSTRPLVVLGRFSYGMYLMHYPISATLRDLVVKRVSVPLVLGSSFPAQLIFDLVAISATLAAAWCSWHLYEKRFLSFKRYFVTAQHDV